jgi:hypothetical protein
MGWIKVAFLKKELPGGGVSPRRKGLPKAQLPQTPWRKLP